MSLNMLLTLVIAVLLIGASVMAMTLVLRQRLNASHTVLAANQVPGTLDEPELQIEGEYVSSTRSDNHLERVHSYGLGLKSASVLCLYREGLVIQRGFSPDLFIPSTDLISVSRASGQIGKFVERNGLITLEWLLGNDPVVSAFRARYSHETQRLIDAMTQLYPHLASAAAGSQPRL